MRFDETAQQWIHTEAEEEAYGLSRTRRAEMPPSLRLLFDTRDREASRLRDRLAAAIELLEQARKAHQHDALGELILKWMRVEGCR